MESIEKLRYYIDRGINHRDEIIKLTDAIEREIAEKYMELPVDTDGVPIKPGNIMQFRDDAPVRVDSIGNSKCYVGDFGWFGDNGGFYGKGTLKCCRHVKPRTMRDILFDFMRDCCTSELTNAELVEKYEVELRELLGGDEE